MKGKEMRVCSAQKSAEECEKKRDKEVADEK
jgi:hypothetical protein